MIRAHIRDDDDDDDEDDYYASSDEESWRTTSEGDAGTATTVLPNQHCPQPPQDGTCLLLKMPDEVLLRVLDFLSHSLTQNPFPGHLDNVIAFSVLSVRLRLLSYPYLWRSIVIRAHLKTSIRQYTALLEHKLQYLMHLLKDQAARHIQSVWIDIHHSTNVAAVALLDAVDDLLEATAPRLVSLALQNWPATLKGMTAIIHAPRLENLRMDDGFVGTRELAASLPETYSGLKRMREIYCSIDTVPYASAVPFKLIRSLPYAEQLVIRGYRERFDAGFFQLSLWSSVRVLALDAGGYERCGFPALFAEFQDYRQDHFCPLEELVLESRMPATNEFEQIITSLKGHTRLKKLSLMVVPRHDAGLLALIADALPHLEELNIVAHASSMVLWIGSPEDYAEGLASFPNLKSFGWNGMPSAEPLLRGARIHDVLSKSYGTTFRRCKKLERFTIWKEFGSTDYYGAVFNMPPRDAQGGYLPAGDGLGDVLSKEPVKRVSFFPRTSGTNIVWPDALQ